VHIEEERLELYALGELPEEASGAVESHLKSCVACGVQFEESRAAIGQWTPTDEFKGPEKRKGRRVATDDPALLTVLQPERSARVEIRIVEASKDGMKLLIPNKVITGAIIQIHVRDLFIMAEVRYCIPKGAKFHAGVQIQDVFPACG
jgi:anti-sigma factor ChrR (cupin superfamily)